MFWGYFAPESNLLRYVNAGHLPPLLFSAAQPGTRFEQGERALEAGDLLVLFSDGILEAANAADEHFGEARVQAIVTAHFHRPAEEIRNQILAAVRQFTGDAEASDDQTLLVIRKSAA